MPHGLRLVPLVGILALTGCACAPPCGLTADPVGRAAGPLAAPGKAFAFYDGKDGSPSSLEAFLRGSEDADLVAFGELHGHPVGAEMELNALEGLAARGRPVALALEFFERDVQKALDEYLAGTSAEADFRKVARQGPAYANTHRPLVEFAKAHHLPVIAANAPRRLVTEYRKSDKSYADYLASLSTADRALLPSETSISHDPYETRWSKLMGPERGPRLLKAQSLWDDSMADAIASFRAAHPETRVMLVVGAFHVAGRLGTITKYAARRPKDRVRLLTMEQGKPPGLAFDPEDQGEGDVILDVEPASGS